MATNLSISSIRFPVRVDQGAPQSFPEDLPLVIQRTRLFGLTRQRPLDVRLCLHQVAQRLGTFPLRNILEQNQYQTLTTRFQKSEMNIMV